MRTTITIDDEIAEKLKSYFPDEKLPTLVHKGLEKLIAYEAGMRLSALGGTDPNAKAAPRRRPPNFVYEDETPYDTDAK